MKIAIISDIHNNIPNLTKVLSYCRENEIEKIICCGDLASIETLDYLNDNFTGEIFYTFGNMDNDFLKNYPFEKTDSSTSLGMTYAYKNTKIFKDFGEAEIDVLQGVELPIGSSTPNKIKIAFVHFPKKARELCETGKYDFVFHGHTHKPWQEKINNCMLLNPGNVGNQIYPPTFAVWNTSDNLFELIHVNKLSQ